MAFRDPLLWTLGASALATVWYLLDRRARDQLTLLDSWAAEHGLHIERDVSVSQLAPFEPLALVAPVVAVQRLMQGQLQIPGLAVGAWMASCSVGNGRRPRRYLIGLFASHPDLPPLRVLPTGVTDAPMELGFVPMPAEHMAAGYKTEAFQPLRRDLTRAVGAVLGEAGPGWRLELRPGRLILAMPNPSGDAPDRMMGLAARLSHALHSVLSREEGATGDANEPGPTGGAPPAAAPTTPPLLN